MKNPKADMLGDPDHLQETERGEDHGLGLTLKVAQGENHHPTVHQDLMLGITPGDPDLAQKDILVNAHHQVQVQDLFPKTEHKESVSLTPPVSLENHRVHHL